MMTSAEVIAYHDKNKRFPDLEELHKAPIGWFPTYPRNPSKLIAHKFVNGKWIELSHAKFVPWPEVWG